MIKNRLELLLLTIFLVMAANILACTTAIISGKRTPDGRPLLWKNRDTGTPDNKIMYFTDGKYDHIALVNSDDSLGQEVWIGMNEAGFAIMNSASYNLNNNETGEIEENEGKIMRLALASCATVDDFEELLKGLPIPYGLETNFGVIDALGGGAYFETSNRNYTRFNVDDPVVAPEGYLIRTNYSFAGELDMGHGYIRYATAEKLFLEAGDGLTPEFILQGATRCLKHSLTGNDLEAEGLLLPEGEHFTWFLDYIPRFSSSSSIVVQGRMTGDADGLMTMWTVLGFPLCSVMYPVWFNEGHALPEILQGGENGLALLSNRAMELKEKCFPVKRGHGEDYINLPALVNRDSTGILQQLRSLEAEIFTETRERLVKWQYQPPGNNEIIEFYKRTNSKILETYRQIEGI